MTMTNFDSLVAKFNEPMLRRKVRLPYVLFGKTKYMREMTKHKDEDGKAQWNCEGTTERPRLFLLPLDSCHCHKEKIEYYTNKGFKILKYWVPQSLDEKRPYNDAHKGSTNFGEDEKEENDRWDQVLGAIKLYSGLTGGAVKSAREDELERRLAEATAKLEAKNGRESKEADSGRASTSRKGVSAKTTREERAGE
jgi:hypothetical protein